MPGVEPEPFRIRPMPSPVSDVPATATKAERAPLITIHRPRMKGGRWISRADIIARGERIQLEASASPKLAKRARDWFNRGAAFVSQWIRFVDQPEDSEAGRGVFADMPEVAYEVATSVDAIPYDENVKCAADLHHQCELGVAEALQQVANINQAAASGDPMALEALNLLELVHCCCHERHELPMAHVFCDAAAGDPHARQVICALREVSPCPGTHLSWSMDDYCGEPPGSLCGNVVVACGDEIGARLATSRQRNKPIHRTVRPTLEPAMLRTFNAILANYG